MGDFFTGEIQIFGFNFAPKGWAQCNGQLLSIAQNQALFALLGTTYGGDGIRTYALPDLRGRLAMGQGAGPGLTPRTLGQVAGEETHTLLSSENPIHTHSVAAISNPTLANNSYIPGPTQILATTTATGSGVAEQVKIYVPDGAPSVAMDPSTVGMTGGQSHNNLMPVQAVNFCIALTGIFPSRN
jgi:microcystin-dependent protein